MSERDLHEGAPGAPANGEWDPEAPEADAAEQHAVVGGTETPAYVPAPADVDEADAAEQQQVVDLDDEDYDR